MYHVSCILPPCLVLSGDGLELAVEGQGVGAEPLRVARHALLVEAGTQQELRQGTRTRPPS